nr:hypothetical protein [Alistipes finegoldii]
MSPTNSKMRANQLFFSFTGVSSSGVGSPLRYTTLGYCSRRASTLSEVSFSAQPSMTTSVPSAACCAVAFTRTPCSCSFSEAACAASSFSEAATRENSASRALSSFRASAMRRSASRMSIDGVFISCASSVTSSPGAATTTK